MNLSAKHGDPQLGIDIHLCTTPAGPVPLPTPHLSVVFDPFDYLPFIGATVKVMGMKRATAGTSAIVVHIPPGFPFAPMIPDKDDELFMGSATVVADGDPLSYLALPVLGCQIAGMPSPPRPKKKKLKLPNLLPTSFNLAIPNTVKVGGAPTISMAGMIARGAFAGLGKLAKSRLGKAMGAGFKKFRQKLFKNMDPGFLKCKVLRAEPVNILTGEVSVEQVDFSLPWRVPMDWVRNYASGRERVGACGVGWESPADARLEIDAADGSVVFFHPDAGPALFPALPAAQGDAAAVLELMDGARLSDHGDEWRVRTKGDLTYHFPKSLTVPVTGQLREVPLGRVSDLCGNWLLYEWVEGRLSAIRESGGRHLLVEYAGRFIRSLSLYVAEAEFSHTFVSYEHDAQGCLTAVRDELDHPYRFAYDGRHMVRHTNRTGLSFHYEYDKRGEGGEEWQVVRAWGDGRLYDYQFAYWPAIREVRITDSLGHVSTVQCDEHGLPILEIDPLGGRTIFEYDEVGRTTAVVDAANHRTEYAYDERGNLLKLTRPDGSAMSIEVDARDKPVAITDPNGASWRQRWDERGLLAEQTSPLGAVTAYEYSADGLLLSVSDALKATTRLGYDTDGQLVSVRNALGHVSRLQRDLLGNVLERSDPSGRATRYRYDGKGRLVEATLPTGARIRCAYDAQGNLTHHEDENGARTRFEYFGQGLIAKRHQPDGHVVQYHYDTEEQLIGVSNQRGEMYELRRDALGRVVEEVDYWGQATRYVFDVAGHLKQSVDPLGRVIDFTTDKLGRVRRKRFEHPFAAGRQFEETFDFDANGNLTGCANEHVTVKRVLDVEGRLIEEQQGDFVIKNGFDLLGRRIRRETSAGNTVAYEYDALGQPTAIRINDEPPITIERDENGQVVKETLAPGLERQYQYDAEGRLTGQGVRRESEWLFSTQYAYDAAGNLTHRKDSQYGLDQFRYDPLGQIVEHIDPQGKLKKFFQDPAGDRLTTGVKRDGTWRREGWCEGVRYRFDAAGNLIERRDERQLDGEEPRTLALAWDANQRLVRSRRRATFGDAEPDEAETVYGYDPMGRRVFKRTGSDEVRFGWDGDALVAERVIDQEPGTRSRREYLYYPHSFVPLAVVDGEVSYRFHNDPNGCPIRVTRGDGRVVWAARQEAWGEARALVDDLANSIRLQGQYEDRETGLHYNRHRYFDPLAGQFVTQDPLGMGAGPHPYQYAANASTWVDPLGLMARRPRYEPVYRQLSAQDRERFDQGLGLTPKGTGGSIAEHVQGIDTQYISASKTAEATKRYASGNGLVKIDVQKVIDGGCNFVDHNNVLSAVERSGDKTAVKNAKLALEVLLKGGIPFEAMELVNGGTCRR
ncbi:RHS repeat-associated core domain-containing protein [Mitsuaria sp. PDC51]|uniref:RHS repeat-associated core domain-containing protein n=1 Tax=Mitsuaria sp. PDC51 TaxID=1881035 RepID=UPI0008E93A2E|nr:RHS repeat-associated core domain-containing protein [Mitsuaria sp. PDC51]SFR77242.1 RHS repeat-associated core domain-containing protein [Mitsuaria sp. PDC51]